jgi:hypothetical protein
VHKPFRVSNAFPPERFPVAGGAAGPQRQLLGDRGERGPSTTRGECGPSKTGSAHINLGLRSTTSSRAAWSTSDTRCTV